MLNILQMNNKLKVAELFISIQGEGLDIGLPCTFVRFNGCNLRCVWCDTPYTSLKPGPFEEYNTDTLLTEILNQHTQGVCITGGEPLIQPKTELVTLITALKKENKFIDIQTNGVLYWPELASLVSRFSVSPKFPSSQMNKLPSLKPEILKKYVDQHHDHKNVLLKFIVEDKDSIEDAFSVIDATPGIADYQVPVIFQPQIDLVACLDVEKQRLLIKQLIESEIFIAANRQKYQHLNFRIIPQIHKILWGDRKKV